MKYRKERVSDAVRKAYQQGRNTANQERKKQRAKRIAKIFTKHRGLILNYDLTTAGVAAQIKRRDDDCNHSVRTLRGYVSEIRKTWQGQMD